MEGIPARFWLFLFASARLLPLIALPGISLLARAPMMVRMATLLALSGVMAMAVPATQRIAPATPGEALWALAADFGLGMTLAVSLQLVFGALRFYGRLVDMQIGFAAAGVIDPTTKNFDALLGSAFSFAALVLMMAGNVHHDLLRALAASMETVPLGGAILSSDPSWLVDAVARQFLFGLLVVIPIVTGLFLLDLVIAYSSRLMPQVNIYFIALPLKIAVGLILTAVTAPFMAHAIGRMFDDASGIWQRAITG